MTRVELDDMTRYWTRHGLLVRAGRREPAELQWLAPSEYEWLARQVYLGTLCWPEPVPPIGPEGVGPGILVPLAKAMWRYGIGCSHPEWAHFEYEPGQPKYLDPDNKVLHCAICRVLVHLLYNKLLAPVGTGAAI